jgi:hypothetical protein
LIYLAVEGAFLDAYSHLLRNQYPVPIRFLFQTQCDLYSKPQACMTCNASGNIGAVAQRNNTQSSAAIYLRDVEPRLQTLTAFTRFSARV